MKKIRQFESGATRDSEDSKNDYEGFLHPLIIQAFGDYMTRHRKQSDGKLRDSDNWQKMFGEKHKDVCIKSMWRHFLDLWLFHRGYEGRDNIEDALAGIIFNAQAYWLKILNDKENSSHNKKQIKTSCTKRDISPKKISKKIKIRKDKEVPNYSPSKDMGINVPPYQA